jgi:hypothetical protein
MRWRRETPLLSALTMKIVLYIFRIVPAGGAPRARLPC